MVKKNNFNTAEQVAEDVEDMGLPAFTKPETATKHYSEAIVDMESHALGEMFAQYTAMTTFAGSMVAAAKNQLLDVQDEFDNVAAALHIEGSDEKVHISKAKANVTPQFQAIRFKVRVAEQKLNLLEASFENYERCANAISREITRRSSEMPFIKRTDNI
jgi:hypothetical protein